MLYRDTGSVDPGLGPIFGSVYGLEIHILGIAYAKDTFPYTKDSFCGSLDTEPVLYLYRGSKFHVSSTTLFVDYKM